MVSCTAGAVVYGFKRQACLTPKTLNLFLKILEAKGFFQY